MKTRSLLATLTAVALLLTAGSAAARPEYTALGTAFTYQGRLMDGGVPATGNYDFEFVLYDAESLGTPVGSAVHKPNVAVADGLFTVQLDFGGGVFDGNALWLEIGVAPGGSGGPYSTLDPRQPISPTPYAIYAAKAPWSGLTGVPAGFADGTDDGSSYQNVVVVAQSGGDYTSIQTALNNITASSGNRYLIYVAPGVYTEQVTMEPYVDIQGSGELNTKITFTGSINGTLLGANDSEVRFLTVENTGGDYWAIGIYNSSASPHLTHVTVAASGGTANYGMENSSSSPTMTDVTASAAGGAASVGVFNGSSSSPTMTNVTASASGGSDSYGVLNVSISTPTMTDVMASASGGTNNYGVYNNFSSPKMSNVKANGSGGDLSYGVYNTSSSSPAMSNVTASASGGTYAYGVFNGIGSSPAMWNMTASASGGTNNYGVSNDSSSPTMTAVTASASGGTSGNYGVYNYYSSPMMSNMTVSATGGDASYGVYNYSGSPMMSNVTASASGGTNNYGVYGSESEVQVSNSRISGSTNSIRDFVGIGNIYVGGSQLSGGPYAGTVACAGVYDENYVFYASTCP